MIGLYIYILRRCDCTRNILASLSFWSYACSTELLLAMDQKCKSHFAYLFPSSTCFACMCPCDTRGLSTSPTKHFPKLGKQTVNCSTLSMSQRCHHWPSSFDELLGIGISWHLVALDKEAHIHLRSCKKPRYFLQSVFDLIPGIGFIFSIFSFPRKKYPNIWGSVPFLLFQRRSCQNHYGHCLSITSLPLQSWVSSLAHPVLRGCHEQIWQLALKKNH